MYKIFLLARDSTTQKLWEIYKVKEIIDDIEETVEFATDDESVLESTMEELGLIYPQKIIKPICELEYKWNADVVGHL